MDLEKEFEISTASNSTDGPAISGSSMPAALQFVFGVLGNLIAIIALFTARKKHKWRPFYRLVLGLALTDGGGILLIFPTIFLRYASNFTYDFPKPLCDYSSFMFIFTLTSSAMIVCALSFDRFMAILYPFRYNMIGKKYRANIMLGLVWISCAFLASLPLMGLGSSLSYYPGSWCFLNFVSLSTLDRVNSFIYSIIGLFILLTTFIFNLCVVITLCRNLATNKRISQKSRKKSDIFNVVFLLVLVLVFATCWTPLMIVIFGHAAAWAADNGKLELFVVRLAVTNSIVDPWIYILFRKENMILITRKIGNIWGKISVSSSSVSNDVIPSPDARKQSFENTLSSARTLSTDDVTV
ncbi:prostaglandin E2 receptor EP4 subtype-like [Crassostrea angulata]|uniref:prostaglandin E2 receptor EP4 subtype-like n=1 Tax=Magallana angulata TaxID=2784310 RepID=UPI0022B0898A|nr:prostaglandin E2 receptor EP4 subtype-like [Crassostrea angulata]